MAPSRRAVAIACRPGDAGADDEHAGGRHGAGGGHHHREAALEGAGALDHRAVAGQVGLAGQHVHRLGAGDAGQQFHRRGIDAGLRQSRHQVRLGKGIGDADQQRAARDQRPLLRQRRLHREDDAGTGESGGRDQGQARPRRR